MMNRIKNTATVLGMLIVSLIPNEYVLGDAVAKQVHLVVKSGHLIASNIRTSRFQEFKLSPLEKISEKAVGKAVIVVATNKHIIAYGVVSGWRELDLRVNEVVETIDVEDYGAFIVTNKRIVNFNGQTGAFGKTRLPLEK